MSADSQLSQASLDDPLAIVIQRTFHAPRELVWKAWTDHAHAARWWGPAGFTTTTHESDFRPGGTWRYTMHGPDGRDYENRIEYLEITEPSRLVYKLGGEVVDENVCFRSEVTFEAIGEAGRQTRVTMRSTFPTQESRDFVVNNFGAVEGGKQHLANLEDYVGSMATQAAVATPFSICRVFSAPREKVWQAWTEREQLLKWFGPTGSTMLHAEIDLRIGGMFHYCMSHSAGMELWGRWVFREIEQSAKLEFISGFSNAAGELVPAVFRGMENFPLETRVTITFVDHAGIGRGTLVTVEAYPFNGTPAQVEFFTSFHGSLSQGWSGTLQQLADFLGT